MQGQNDLTENVYQFTNSDKQLIHPIFLNLRNEGINISEAELSNLLRPFFKQGFRTPGTLEILNPLLDYLPHKFLMREALVVNRCIRGLLHPTHKEIDKIMERLQNEEKEFPLLKLRFESNNQAIDCDTIIVIGSYNVGKDMFICNLINYLYKVDYFNLYRISIINTEQMDECIEYVVQYDEKIFYKIISCPAIGNIIQDSKKIISILEKISMEHNKIVGIFLINSACKTRLGIEEKYNIQRFFELFPKDYLDNIFLILTSSTDNFANTDIYKSDESPTPINFKERIPKTSQDENDNITILRCFAFNNNCIYQMDPYDRIYPKVQNIKDGIRSGSPDNDDLTNQTDSESVTSSKQKEVGDMFCQYWNKDYKTMDMLYQELQEIKNNKVKIQQMNISYFQYLKGFEEKLNIFLQLFIAEKVEQFQYKISPNRFYLQTSVISITQPKGEDVMKGTQALFCSKCHIICHISCQLTTLENFEDLTFDKRCYKFDGQLENDQQKPTECKNCKKFDPDSRCSIKIHQLLSTISVIDLYQDSRPNENRCTARQFIDQYLENKIIKREHQQQRLKYYENQKEKERQRKMIVEDLAKLKNQGLLDINLKTRLEYIDESIKIRSNDNQEKIEYINRQKMYQYLICNEQVQQNQIQQQQIQQAPLNIIAIVQDHVNNQEIQSNNEFSIPEDNSPQRDNLRNSAIYNGLAPLIPSYKFHKKQ